MTGFAKVSLFLLRVGIGWLFFYAGITKVLDSAWSAEKYLVGAKTFPGFYQWLASPGVLPMTNLLNEWGLTLIGAALILGIFVRLASLAGVVVMLLYYFPALAFPYPNPHSYIVDEHIIYALALLVLSTSRAGKVWGLERLRR
ncbi:MAG: DoxX family protein [Candidatus Colwellbacteria bacterium]|nr:DoxX family protein [Candidatus Colwellbacteria bacterium]